MKNCQNFTKKENIDYEIFNFTHRIIDYYSKVNLVITRSGASALGEILNFRLPFIAIPLPNSADNHQLKNAIFYEKKGYGYFLEEVNISKKLYNLIISIATDKNKIQRIISNQSQYSDKEIFKKLNINIEKIIDEKINLGQYDLVHFVGIGGIGMSGLAQIMKNMGFRVQGSDQNKNKNIVSCSRNGIKTFIGHSVKNLKKVSILVKSTAIKKK